MPDLGTPELADYGQEHAQGIAADVKSVMERRVKNYSLLAIERLGAEKVTETSAFFTEHRASLGKTPIEHIVTTYETLVPPEDKDGQAIFTAAVRQHAAKVIEYAFDQQVENPRRFLSHGFDHSLNVSEAAHAMLEKNPQFVTSMREKYGISEGLAQFMLHNVVFFHDIGYRYLGDRGKAAHALAGAEIVASERVRDIFRSIIRSQEADISRETVELLLHDFRDAILFHNADTVQHAFDAKVVTSLGEFLVDTPHVVDVVSTFRRQASPGTPREVTSVYVQNEGAKQHLEEVLREQDTMSPIQIIVLDTSDAVQLRGRVLDLQQKDDGMLGLEYKEIDAVDAPMQAFIRIADNMDMTPNRFIGVQHEPAFQEANRRFGDGKDESQILKRLEALSERIKHETALASNADRMMATAKATDRAIDVIREHLTEQEHADTSLKERIGNIMKPADAEVVWKEVIVRRIFAKEEFAGLSQEKRDAIVAYAVALDSKELKHFGGCEPVLDVTLEDTIVTVRVDSNKFASLNTIALTEELVDANGERHQVSIGVGEYQIWRMAQAYKSIHIAEKPLSIRIVDENDNELKTIA